MAFADNLQVASCFVLFLFLFLFLSLRTCNYLWKITCELLESLPGGLCTPCPQRGASTHEQQKWEWERLGSHLGSG